MLCFTCFNTCLRLTFESSAYKQAAGLSISTDSRRNFSVTLLIEVSYFFLERRSNWFEMNNVVKKMYPEI